MAEAIKERKGKGSGRDALSILTKQGDRIPLSFMTVPIFGKRKKLIGSVVIFKNIPAGKIPATS